MERPDLHSPKLQEHLHQSMRFAILSFGLIAAIIWILTTQFSETIQINWHEINWILLIVGWGWMLVSMLALGWRWKVLLPQTPTSVSGLFLGSSLAGGLLINYALPGPMGEVAAAWLWSQKSKGTLVEGLSTAAIARLFGLFTAATGSILLWPWIQVEWEYANWLLNALLIGITLGGIFLWMIFTLPDAVAAVLQHRISNPSSKILGLLLQFTTAFSNLQKQPKSLFFKAIFFSVLGHFAAFLGVYCSILALYPNSAILEIAFTYLVGTCCGALAFLFPGSQLPWDGIFAALLISTAQFDISIATQAVLLLRIEQLAMMLVGGISMVYLLQNIDDSNI